MTRSEDSTDHMTLGYKMAGDLALRFAVAIVLLHGFCLAKPTTLWVVYNADNSTFSIASVKPADFVAVASFDNTINKTGWAKLDVTTTSGGKQAYSDSMQAYAAGFVEGHITRPLMEMHWINTVAGFCPEPLSLKCKGLKGFFEKNLEWMKAQIKSQAADDPYWYHVQLYLEQMAGLQDGYSNYPGKLNTDIDVLGVYMWQVGGDMEDLSNLFPDSSEQLTKENVDPSLSFGPGRCSALLRLLPGNTDLYVSQDTWSDLSSMLRILKRYSFELHMTAGSKELAPGNTMTFSSYPGPLMSGDDFYAISSGLVSQETTIGFSNAELVKYITSEAVMEGFRSMVANRLASSGLDWSKLFAQYNSGTYNNQWMIVDYKRFVPSRETGVPGTFYLIEQIPGTIEYADLTDYLYEKSYFGSYNVPYFPDIFNKSGLPPLVKKFGDWFTYDKNPRALIYKRDVPKVTDLDSMTKLMRYNNFKNDPLSRCNCTPPYSAENAISCRDDLNPANGTYPFGALGHRPHIGTDMKLISYDLFKSLSFLAISSPTYDDLPPFQWSKSDYNYMSHLGHPDVWKFPRILFKGTDPLA
ncbi:putative phospholipase B-like 2 [Aplysia californica]|uniref:Phospholipase B-like n=1 Tax=Aplysia californica TaxID=6500 RepID=A0ABM1ABV5_APLCA|nr:putative phospholipase B-like 2 [Aplysia californica]